VNIHNNANAQITAEESTDENGNVNIDLLVGMVDSALSQKAAKNQSQLANTVAQKYGLNGDRQLFNR
jgi:hypothetical protein